MPERPNRALRRCLLALGAAAALAACGTPPPAPEIDMPPPLETREPPLDAPPAPPPAPEPPPALPPQSHVPAQPLAAALAYADRVRGAPAAALAPEIARLSQPGAAPLQQLQLALALQQMRTSADSARALQALQRLLAIATDEARELHPLARLLQAQLAEQRKLEEAGERQSQQLRDAQRRIDQLTERMEALRAIERRRPSR